VSVSIKPLEDRIVIKQVEAEKLRPPVSSSRTPRKRSPKRAKLSPSAPAASTTTAIVFPLT